MDNKYNLPTTAFAGTATTSPYENHDRSHEDPLGNFEEGHDRDAHIHGSYAAGVGEQRLQRICGYLFQGLKGFIFYNYFLKLFFHLNLH